MRLKFAQEELFSDVFSRFETLTSFAIQNPCEEELAPAGPVADESPDRSAGQSQVLREEQRQELSAVPSQDLREDRRRDQRLTSSSDLSAVHS
jgi:hypothetical protein